MDVSLSELRELVMDREAGVLQFMGSQRVGHDWATDLIWSDLASTFPGIVWYLVTPIITSVLKIIHIVYEFVSY